MIITVVINDPDVPPGHLASILEHRGIGMALVDLAAGEDVPEVGDVEAVVVMGGEMGAYDVDRYPYLKAEKRFLADAVDAGVPVLGICLGCQLLSDALGGAAYLAETPEYHLGPIDVCEPDATVATLGDGVSFSLHRDTWHLPPGGVLVARTDRFNHAFRAGSALGVQSHPELTLGTLRSWLATVEGRVLAVEAGVDVDTIIDEFAQAEAESEAVATAFFDAWLDEISG